MSRQERTSRRATRRRKGRGASHRAEITISKKAGSARISEQRLRRLIGFVARAEGRDIAAVDLAVVPEAEMAALNRKYLRCAGATDVLSFDLSDAGRPGGGPGAGLPAGQSPIAAQIVVCGDLAARQARRHGHSAARELMLYVVHGLLHLMGYDDAGVRAAARMHAREQELLAAFAPAPASARRPGRRAKP